MKNTTFKRRALISSIAMLLVALVALGSATFAWFAANPNASAEGLSVKTTAAAGLVIRTESDSTWSHDADLFKGQTDAFLLNPVSQEQTKANSGNFWKVAAAAANNFAAGSDNMTAATIGGYNNTSNVDLYAEKVYFALTAGSDATAEASKEVKITGITITPKSGAALQNAINVCITAADGTILGTWELSLAGDNGTLTTASKTPGTFSPEAAVAATNLNVSTGQTALPIQGDTLTKYVNVYVYLDGQDSACYSEGLAEQDASQIIEKIKVDFNLA